VADDRWTDSSAFDRRKNLRDQSLIEISSFSFQQIAMKYFLSDQVCLLLYQGCCAGGKEGNGANLIP
jgi:hypothetical protein